ncbi:hypothetical protein EV657_11641 [Rhodovulum visakhapatnamense]|uniref:Uncharacterized protein n=1 Tax=Rhodovulum visakhapatnamense TaxID=364297 RepID=A0A4R8FN80_9RHOB|nr:hypothetical protein EV657_11641 [Rhodovulum visakhapatnamense]
MSRRSTRLKGEFLEQGWARVTSRARRPRNRPEVHARGGQQGYGRKDEAAPRQWRLFLAYRANLTFTLR